MASMDHSNVVRLYALCMGQNMMLISEFVMLGSLLSFLRKHKDNLNALTMMSFIQQIAEVSCMCESCDCHMTSCETTGQQ